MERRNFENLASRGAIAIALILLGNASMLGLDALRMAAGVAGAASAFGIGLVRVLVLALCGWMAASVRRTDVVSPAVFTAALTSSAGAVLVAHARADPGTMPLPIATVTMGVAVFFPWATRWQGFLVAATLASLTAGILLLDLQIAPDLLSLTAFIILLSVYLCHAANRARRQIREIEDRAAQALESAKQEGASLQEEVLRQTGRLRDALAELAGFTSAASHDIRPPLRTMAGYAEILEESGDGLAPGRVRTLALRMGKEIDDLLAGARVAQRLLDEKLDEERIEVPNARAAPGEPRVSHQVLMDRTRQAVALMLLTALVASLTDMMAPPELFPALLWIGGIRATLLGCLLWAIYRTTSVRFATSLAWSAATLLLLHLPLPAVVHGDTPSISLLAASSSCIALSAFVPWGWKRQLAIVAIATCGAAAQMAFHEPAAPGGAAPFVLAVAAFVLSMPIAVLSHRDEQGRTRASGELLVARDHHRQVAELLASEVDRRSDVISGASRRLVTACSELERRLRPSLAEVRGLVADQPADREDGESSKASILWSRIDDAAEGMGRTLTALLNYLQLAHVRLRWEAVDLSQVAESSIEKLRQAHPGRKVRVEIEPSMAAWGDPALLAEAMDHLLSNAWKFTEEESEARIEVGVQPMGERGDLVFVRDNGVGLDPRFLEKLFRPFSRLETVEAFPGLGIGLARVRRIVSLHGGEVFSGGERGCGAEIGFLLPRSRPGGIHEKL